MKEEVVKGIGVGGIGVEVGSKTGVIRCLCPSSSCPPPLQAIKAINGIANIQSFIYLCPFVFDRNGCGNAGKRAGLILCGRTNVEHDIHQVGILVVYFGLPSSHDFLQQIKFVGLKGLNVLLLNHHVV